MKRFIVLVLFFTPTLLFAEDAVNPEVKKLQEQVEKANLEMELMELEFKRKMLHLNQEMQKSRLEWQHENADLVNKANEAELKWKTKEKRNKGREFDDEWNAKVNKNIEYTNKPFKDGVLRVSDRRIDLNGAIIWKTGAWVSDRIHYYNNKSEEYPIFIVIDNCPGGSVREGLRILQAMKSSKAPIHVVVKEYAASMAAVITTLADHSYVYPNAIVLHHEVSSFAWGKTSFNEEDMEFIKRYEARLLGPVAKKMGLSLAEFKKKMFENSLTGDWKEFGDDAVKLKWVNHVIEKLHEEGMLEKPTEKAPTFGWIIIMEKTELPVLGALDFYYLHDPNKRYSISKD